MSTTQKNRYRVSYVPNSQWGKGFTTWFRYLIEELRMRGNTVVVNEILNYNGIPLDFKTLANESGKCNVTFKITDCDVVVENKNTLDISVVSFSEFFEFVVKDFLESKFVKELYMAHCHYPTIHEVVTKFKNSDSYRKVKPFFALVGGSDEFYSIVDNYKHRWNLAASEPKMFFAGDTSYRQSVDEIFSNYSEQIIEKSSFTYPDQYFEAMISCRVGLSYFTDYEISYRYNELCFRDMEYAALGIPFLRIEFYLPLKNQLIPDYHYISIPREKAYYEYKTGGNKAVSELIVKRFNEVKDDYKYLEFISSNIKSWYDENASLSGMTKNYIEDSQVL